MKSLRSRAALLAATGFFSAVALAAPDDLTGFKAASSDAERAAEKAFDGALDPAEMRAWLQQMSAEPNPVGSEHDKANADFMLAKYKEWGWDARIETFEVLAPSPKSVLLELVGPTPFKAKLAEAAVDGDHTAGAAGTMPAYNAFGADGDVTGDLVYANYGLESDFAELARRGIDVKGKIVLTRYGACFRGLKARNAQEHGAIACLIYSDPHEDGYFVGDPYPKGAWRPEDGIQRGSVEDLTLYAGDALTPGVGATKDAKRLDPADAMVLPKIPVLPLSYGDAKPLLAALEGPVAPAAWRGALPLTYHLGPGPAKVHVAVASDWGLKTIYDVIAVMPGSTFPNQWVIRGNHHDGWVTGAWDPLAGNVSVMEEAKAIGALVKTGWRPKRTLVYCSWDGEEYGLLGSTEWAETHAAELQRKAVLYVNSDTIGRGLLTAGGSPSFQHLVNEVAGEVPDPETGVSLLARHRASIQVDHVEGTAYGDDGELYKAAEAGGDLPNRPLGGGSDYSPFLQHLGIATLDLAFNGEDADQGIYHSAYDSFDHFVRFGDPKFAYVTALAQTSGRLMLRTADADVLPLRFSDLAATVSLYLEQVEGLANAERARSRKLQQMIDAGLFKLAADPEVVRGPPESPGAVPPIDFSALRAAVVRLRASAQAYDAAFAKAAASDFRLPSGEVQLLNGLLQGMEQALLMKAGLPGRPWYQHALTAPGTYTGYGAKTLPGIREAIEAHRWEEATANIAVVTSLLGEAAIRLDAAAKQLVPHLGVGAAPAGPMVPTPPPPPDA
jgi:N-acetylated-alpha-linked acidic dipeptidase